MPATLRSNYSATLPALSAASTSLLIAVLHCFYRLSEHVRPGWPSMESSLGECHKGLANVQLPSWSHAELRGIRTNEERALAAAVLSCTIPPLGLGSHRLFNPVPTGGRAIFQLPSSTLARTLDLRCLLYAKSYPPAASGAKSRGYKRALADFQIMCDIENGSNEPNPDFEQ